MFLTHSSPHPPLSNPDHLQRSALASSGCPGRLALRRTTLTRCSTDGVSAMAEHGVTAAAERAGRRLLKPPPPPILYIEGGWRNCLSLRTHLSPVLPLPKLPDTVADLPQETCLPTFEQRPLGGVFLHTLRNEVINDFFRPPGLIRILTEKHV